MRVWSKGLGNMTLNIDFNTSRVNWEDGHLTVTGWIKDPVVWNYRITIEDHDIKGLFKVVTSRYLLWFVLKWLGRLFHRRAKESVDTVNSEQDQ